MARMGPTAKNVIGDSEEVGVDEGDADDEEYIANNVEINKQLSPPALDDQSAWTTPLWDYNLPRPLKLGRQRSANQVRAPHGPQNNAMKFGEEYRPAKRQRTPSQPSSPIRFPSPSVECNQPSPQDALCPTSQPKETRQRSPKTSKSRASRPYTCGDAVSQSSSNRRGIQLSKPTSKQQTISLENLNRNQIVVLPTDSNVSVGKFMLESGATCNWDLKSTDRKPLSPLVYTCGCKASSTICLLKSKTGAPKASGVTLRTPIPASSNSMAGVISFWDRFIADLDNKPLAGYPSSPSDAMLLASMETVSPSTGSKAPPSTRGNALHTRGLATNPFVPTPGSASPPRSLSPTALGGNKDRMGKDTYNMAVQVYERTPFLPNPPLLEEQLILKTDEALEHAKKEHQKSASTRSSAQSRPSNPKNRVPYRPPVLKLTLDEEKNLEKEFAPLYPQEVVVSSSPSIPASSTVLEEHQAPTKPITLMSTPILGWDDIDSILSGLAFSCHKIGPALDDLEARVLQQSVTAPTQTYSCGHPPTNNNPMSPLPNPPVPISYNCGDPASGPTKDGVTNSCCGRPDERLLDLQTVAKPTQVNSCGHPPVDNNPIKPPSSGPPKSIFYNCGDPAAGSITSVLTCCDRFANDSKNSKLSNSKNLLPPSKALQRFDALQNYSHIFRLSPLDPTVLDGPAAAAPDLLQGAPPRIQPPPLLDLSDYRCMHTSTAKISQAGRNITAPAHLDPDHKTAVRSLDQPAVVVESSNKISSETPPANAKSSTTGMTDASNSKVLLPQDLVTFVESAESGKLLDRWNWGAAAHPQLRAMVMSRMPVAMLDDAWKRMGAINQPVFDYKSLSRDLNVWMPSMFADCESRTYATYFPAVVERFGRKGVQAFDRALYDKHTMGQRLDLCDWLIMPHFGFLKNPPAHRVLTSGNGLVVQEFEWYPGMDINQLLYSGGQHIDVDSDLFVAGETVLLVANFLTRELKILPPIFLRSLKKKVACFSFPNAGKSMYRLVVVGTTSYQPDASNPSSTRAELFIVVYDSVLLHWRNYNYIKDARSTPRSRGGPSGCVIINKGVYVGGERVHGGKVDLAKKIATPALIYFNVGKKKRQKLIFDFNVATQFGVGVLEPPKVVRVDASRIYAVTRGQSSNESMDKLFVCEVLLNVDGIPTGSYKEAANGFMPDDVFQILFSPEMNATPWDNPPYDVACSNALIAFKLSESYLHNSKVILYDVRLAEWTVADFPATFTTTIESDMNVYDLVPGAIEPNWNSSLIGVRSIHKNLT